MKKICIIGNFSKGKDGENGQTIKTKIFYKQLCLIYGKDNILLCDTSKSIKGISILFMKIILMLFKCKNIIMFPATRGLKLIVPYLVFFNRFFDRNLNYIVIGGWLPSYISNDKKLKRVLTKIDYIYVETNIMNKSLVAMGFKNIITMPNCKDIKIIEPSELTNNNSEHYKLCTFSRVMKEKGIEDAIDAVSKLNNTNSCKSYILDIYGPVDDTQRDWFNSLQSKFPKYVKYKGVVAFNESVNIIKNYDVLLFPTYYIGEGFAGTILDAYASGVPVIASDWKYNTELVKDNQTGFIFKTRNIEDFSEYIQRLCCSENYYDFKLNCIIEAHKYVPENIVKILTKNLE